MEDTYTTPLLLEKQQHHGGDTSSYGIENNDLRQQESVLSSIAVPLSTSDNEEPVSSSTVSLTSFSWISIIRMFIVPGIGGLLFGYDISSTSFILIDLMKQHISMLTSFIQGFIVSTSSIGATIGSFSLYYFNIPNYIGRRTELRYSALFYWFGILLQIIASYIWSTMNNTNTNTSGQILSLGLLLIGRIIFGIGIALAMHGGPTYIAEMMPYSIRGIFVSCKEAFIVLGIVLGYIIGYHYSNSSSNRMQNDIIMVDDVDIINTQWIRIYYYSILLSTIMYIVSFSIPESTRWLLFIAKQYDVAYQSLLFIYPNNPSFAKDELNLLQAEHIEQYEQVPASSSSFSNVDDVQQQNHNEDNALLSNTDELRGVVQQIPSSSIWSKQYRSQLIAGVGLVILQQITGQPSVLSYATIILRHAHVSDSFTIWLGLFKFITTLLAAFTVELYGRKKLLYIGNTLMLLSLIILTFNISSSSTESTSSSSSSSKELFALISLFIYIGGYQFSFGPISWLIVSEIFPFSIRGTAVAISVTMNFLFNSIVQLLIPILQNYFGYNITFGIFALLTAYRYVK